MAKSSNKWLERYTDGGLYIPLEGTSYVVRQQISKPRTYGNGGKYLTVNGEYHRVYENAEGDIMVNHPKEDKGKWDTINLTQKAKAKTIAQGIAATKKWHKENPEYANGGLGDGDDPKKPKTVIYNDYNKYLKAKQAYTDSLNLYNSSKIMYNHLLKNQVLDYDRQVHLYRLLEQSLQKTYPTSNQKKIQPINFNTIRYNDVATGRPGIWHVGKYAKPKVNPKYQEPEEVKSKDESFMFPGVLSYDKKEMTPFAEEDLNFSDYTKTINDLKENESEIKKPNTQIKNNNSSSFKNKIKKLKREFFPGYRLPYQYQSAKVSFFENGGLNDQDPPVESLRSATTYSVTPQSNATYPIIPQNFEPIKWDAKTQKEIELLQKSINERTKNTPEFKQARKLTKEEQDYSDKVKARMKNPSADLGILAANMASAFTRLQYLTPDEIKKITNNPKGTIEVAADILEQGLINELTGGALTALSKAAPQAIESVGKYLTEGPLKNMHKLNPWALTESKIVPEGTVARQIYGDEAFKNFQKYGPTTTPGISEAEQLVEFAKAPTSEIRFRNGEIVNVASTMNKHGFQYPYFSEGKLWFTPEQAKYFGGKERIITTPSSEVFRPAGEASVMMGNPSKEAIEQYARSRRILMPGTEYANPSKYDVYERDWLQGFKKVSERKQSTTFNLQNRRSKPKSTMYKHDEIVEDPNFNIKKIYRGDKETPKVIRVKGKSGEWTLNKANDGSYYFNAAMSNPLESGKAMLKINEMLPPKPVILEPNSLSLDSYLNTIKLGKRPHWKMEFENYIPLNHSATKNQTLSNMFGFKPEGTHVPFSSLEDANVALKEVNAMLKKQGIKHEADVFSNGNGWYGIKIPNFKLTRDYKNGGWLNQYEQGGYADDSAVLNSEGQEVNTMQFALPTVPTFNFGNGNGNGNGDGDGEDPKDKKKSKDKKTDTRTIGQKRHDALEAAKTKILKTESPENKKKMDMLYSTTMAAENTYGYDPKAYGRKKQTRSPMSIDNIALDELFNPKGEKNRYTLQQKSNFDLLRSLGLPTDKAKLKELLETDDAYAGLGVAKTLYYNEGALKNLPNPTDTAAYINLYLNEYNKSGALKYQKRNELIDNITNKMRAQGKRETKTIKPVVKNKTTK